jgi:hypothetical protein
VNDSERAALAPNLAGPAPAPLPALANIPAAANSTLRCDTFTCLASMSAYLTIAKRLLRRTAGPYIWVMSGRAEVIDGYKKNLRLNLRWFIIRGLKTDYAAVFEIIQEDVSIDTGVDL